MSLRRDIEASLTTGPFTNQGCLLWQGATNLQGYGRVWDGTKLVSVHRLAYTLCVGPIPQGHNVLHRCDNPACFAPAHLFVGTQRDNVEDCQKKSRHAFGARNGRRKLNESQVCEIKQLLAYKRFSQQEIANRFFVNVKTVNNIDRGQCWSHITTTQNSEV